ncbi:hypothetical protein PC9H_000013 [Pleurotus ostreatus]|uniref:Uncharacterized protein n=1 Tax=Pleurotus ostreatus TaxID=5322 RepID=A0A8H7A2W9_PLEOS|nr:uncharacterized protein PC9H_000013 [Pleurotus ostreatus]KAF7439677.1 hypothetical protein PC9H_000013 [Pleurotus ostreatus]
MRLARRPPSPHSANHLAALAAPRERRGINTLPFALLRQILKRAFTDHFTHEERTVPPARALVALTHVCGARRTIIPQLWEIVCRVEPPAMIRETVTRSRGMPLLMCSLRKSTTMRTGGDGQADRDEDEDEGADEDEDETEEWRRSEDDGDDEHVEDRHGIGRHEDEDKADELHGVYGHESSRGESDGSDDSGDNEWR